MEALLSLCLVALALILLVIYDFEVRWAGKNKIQLPDTSIVPVIGVVFMTVGFACFFISVFAMTFF